MKEKIAIVTGGNRGLGLEVSRQLAQQKYHVVLTSRDGAKGKAAQELLKKDGLDVETHVLDVTQPESIVRLAKWAEEKFGTIHVLVNNAGVFIDLGGFGNRSALDCPKDVFMKTLESNAWSALAMCQAFIPLMEKGGFGRVANVSSKMGQLSDMGGGYASYRVSKTALNAVTRIFASETKGKNILVNAISPGWVKTDMGGAGAERTPEEGADTIVWAATLPDDGPTGCFLHDRKVIEW